MRNAHYVNTAVTIAKDKNQEQQLANKKKAYLPPALTLIVSVHAITESGTPGLPLESQGGTYS